MTTWTPVAAWISCSPRGSGFSPPQLSSTIARPPSACIFATSSTAMATSWSWYLRGWEISP